MNYRSVNATKQYLHSLQTVPLSLLAQHKVSGTRWQEHLTTVRTRLRQRELCQENAVLSFLLVRRTYPMTVTHKVHYISIGKIQDSAPPQVALLQALSPKANLTFCGDLNQGVSGNETIVRSLEDLSVDRGVTRFQLTTSYCSIREIVDLANHFIMKEHRVEATTGKGDLPLPI